MTSISHFLAEFYIRYKFNRIASLESVGLREDKKAQARQTISNVATALFLERGFDAVSVADVAIAAKVSKMTVM